MNTNNSFNITALPQEQMKKIMVVVLILALAALLMALPETALAGESGTGDFESIWVQIKDWTKGSLGRVIAGTMILVGIIGGIARQSIMAFAVGAGGGMGLTYAPDIIETIVSATITHADSAAAAAVTIGNGLGM